MLLIWRGADAADSTLVAKAGATGSCYEYLDATSCLAQRGARWMLQEQIMKRRVDFIFLAHEVNFVSWHMN